jgi:hypothetical protein
MGMNLMTFSQMETKVQGRKEIPQTPEALKNAIEGQIKSLSNPGPSLRILLSSLRVG